MRRYLVAGAALGLLAIPAVAFGGTTASVTVAPNDANTFAPGSVSQTVGGGDTHWQWDTDGKTFAMHNVRQDDKLFYSGKPTNNNPSGFDVVPSAGKFHYFCEVHGPSMSGTIKIKPAIFDQEKKSFGVRWSTGSKDTGNAFDVRYRVNGGKWKVWKNDVTKGHAVFGAKHKPVRVRGGKTYDIEARSEKKSKPSKHSKWSPPAQVQT
jgi:plastocyanin